MRHGSVTTTSTRYRPKPGCIASALVVVGERPLEVADDRDALRDGGLGRSHVLHEHRLARPSRLEVTPFCVPMPFSRMWIARSGYRGGTDGAPPGVRVGRSAASRPAIVFRLRMRRHGAVSPEERSSALEYLRLEDGDE